MTVLSALQPLACSYSSEEVFEQFPTESRVENVQLTDREQMQGSQVGSIVHGRLNKWQLEERPRHYCFMWRVLHVPKVVLKARTLQKGATTCDAHTIKFGHSTKGAGVNF